MVAFVCVAELIYYGWFNSDVRQDANNSNVNMSHAAESEDVKSSTARMESFWYDWARNLKRNICQSTRAGTHNPSERLQRLSRPENAPRSEVGGIFRRRLLLLSDRKKWPSHEHQARPGLHSNPTAFLLKLRRSQTHQVVVVVQTRNELKHGRMPTHFDKAAIRE